MSQRVNLSILKSTLTYDYKLWVMIGRMIWSGLMFPHAVTVLNASGHMNCSIFNAARVKSPRERVNFMSIDAVVQLFLSPAVMVPLYLRF